MCDGWEMGRCKLCCALQCWRARCKRIQRPFGRLQTTFFRFVFVFFFLSFCFNAQHLPTHYNNIFTCYFCSAHRSFVVLTATFGCWCFSCRWMRTINTKFFAIFQFGLFFATRNTGFSCIFLYGRVWEWFPPTSATEEKGNWNDVSIIKGTFFF